MTNDNEQKERILSAAKNLFSRFGLEKTTMEDIAKAAGKGKSSLYYYFKSKEEVMPRLSERRSQASRQSSVRPSKKRMIPITNSPGL